MSELWGLSQGLSDGGDIVSSMKVLLVNPSCWIYGGAERVIVKLCNWLTDHHHRVTILTTQLNNQITADLKDTRIVMADDVQDMQQFIHKAAHDFDVINIHNEPGYLTVYPKKRNVVWLCNEPPHLDQPEPNELELEAVRNFNVVVADEFNAKRFEELYKIKPSVIPYGVDYDFFSEKTKDMLLDKYRENLGITKEDFVVTQVGFVAPTKNQLRTIEIFKKLKEKKPNAKLILAGHQVEPYAKEVKDKIIQYGLMQDVYMLGYVPRETVRTIYQISNAVLMPMKPQGGWLSVFEAMSAGCPVFTSEETTCASILDQNDLGYVCKTDDQFVQEILTFETDGVKEAAWVKVNLTWDKFCEGMYNEFEKSTR
jgi:glycosyltransferase involved in cell wall biosynthesis